ncbi:fimbrillin family protein [Bacteroides caecigallinarum]|uniref:fimbrillin family protein n=1 Tax=Bacteroides caecigallinarum TaxID=1411144 RepID=UPI001F3F053D|nr:fimbrillin family protein [Bacteroides caecigallinarum]MCF2593268.1 fimbrillin family protein [Bacteroides caecigallinarum]
MKKNVFWLAAMAAAVSLTGCSVDEVVEKAEVRNIGFDAFANKSSRATVNAKTFGHTSFGVWGRYDEGGSSYVNVFNNKEVKWSNTGNLDDANGAWEYSPLVPWVADKDYTFAAVAPYNAAFSYDYTNGYTLGEITLDATYSEGKYTNQVDYLTATVKSSVQSTISGGKVGFTFNHIVSNIIFNFQPKIANTGGETTAWTSPVQIIIKNITLSNVLTNKKYTNNTWSAADSPNTSGSFVTTLSSDNITTYEPAGPTGTPTQVLTPLENKFSWFVVPQTEEQAPNRKLTLTFDIKTKDASGAYNVVAKTGATASVDIDTDWDANTQYTYTVYIGTDVLGQDAFITFDVTSVAGWGNSSPVEDDINVTPSTGD